MEGTSFFGSMWDGLSNFIHGAVGNNRDNNPADVMNVKSALQNAGVMAAEQEPHGYITRPMDDAVRQFQKMKGLKVDGFLLPGGETERALLTQESKASELNSIAQKTLDNFKQANLKSSERFFKNYLEGEGKPIRLNSKEIDNSPVFKKAIETNNRRFEDSILKGFVDDDAKNPAKQSSFKNQILQLKDGESKVLNNRKLPGGGDFWDRDIGFYDGELIGDKDQARSTGSTKLRSYGSLKAKRIGKIIEIDGAVDNRINDLYNFDTDTILDRVLFKDYKRMSLQGKAKPFLVYGSRLQKVKGLIEIENGRIKNSDFKWEKIDP